MEDSLRADFLVDVLNTHRSGRMATRNRNTAVDSSEIKAFVQHFTAAQARRLADRSMQTQRSRSGAPPRHVCCCKLNCSVDRLSEAGELRRVEAAITVPPRLN